MGETKEMPPFILRAREAQDAVRTAAEQIEKVMEWVPLLRARIEKARSGSARTKADAELAELQALVACAEACVLLRRDFVPFRRELRDLRKALSELTSRVAAKREDVA